MKKKIFLTLAACSLAMGQAWADNVLTVSEVNVPQGGQATLEIGCEFDTEYTAFELQVSLPAGMSLVTDEDGYPVIEKAFDTNHILTGNLLTSNGNYNITCRSMENLSMPTSGTLFRLTVEADASLTPSTCLNASITACEFTRTADSEGESLDDVTFSVNIVEFRTILDENSTDLPTSEANANVRVQRTISAGNWSSVCLPFAMTEAQCKEAFGEDVQIADFTGAEVDDDGNISVNFNSVAAMEANHPYIIKVGNDVTEFTVNNVDISPEETPIVDRDEETTGTGRNKKTTYNSFIGTYVAETVVPDFCLFLSGNQFWFSTGNTKMKAFRAYFDLATAGADYTTISSSNIHLNVMEDETTEVERITNSELQVPSATYDLQGRRLNGKWSMDNGQSKKGVYVRDGKKVVIK